MATVKVPEKFAPIFREAESYVARYFADRKESPEHGSIEISGERYMLVRAGAMSVEFFEMVESLYRDEEGVEAQSVARGLLFDIAHAMGLADALVFAKRMGVEDPIERLSAGPVHFAHAGWAFVDISEESHPSPDENYCLVYDHPYSFESASWLAAGKTTDCPICVMNAGYSSGWCESSFGVQLVATEILCRAKGDAYCRFIMAPPAVSEARIEEYLGRHPEVRPLVTRFEIPGFFSRKSSDAATRLDQMTLRRTNQELERRVAERTRELSEANRKLEADIVERRHTETALRRSEELNQSIIGALPGGIVHVSPDGRISAANARACSILGLSWDALLQRYTSDFDPETIWEDGTPCRLEDYPATRALVTGEAQPSQTIGVKRPDGTISWAIFTAVPTRDPDTNQVAGAVVTFLDITKRKMLEEEQRRLAEKVRQTQKLESLGVLAGGVAHDFNNLLVGVLANAALAGQLLQDRPDVADIVGQIETAAGRAAELTKQMLAYSGRGRFETGRLGLSEAVRELLGLLRATVPSRVRFEMDLADELSPIEGDLTQVRQVVMNVITNAAESIEGADGKVTVKTSAVERTTQELGSLASSDELPGGLYVMLEITDTGCGMSPETQGKIFDPFFTTKFSGRGLGLAAVLGIMRGHHGTIQIETAVGRGTVVQLLFPAASEPGSALPELSSPTPIPPAAEKKSKQTALTNARILVVDDDESVRRVLHNILQRSGANVLLAQDGESGLAAFRENKGQLTAVLLDLTMPGMSGSETFENMRKEDPQVPVILTSCYTEEEATDRFQDRGLAGFLAKPFSPKQLRETLDRALSRGKRGKQD
jgi:PAS domain S-box-containing protein